MRGWCGGGISVPHGRGMRLSSAARGSKGGWGWKGNARDVENQRQRSRDTKGGGGDSYRRRLVQRATETKTSQKEIASTPTHPHNHTTTHTLTHSQYVSNVAHLILTFRIYFYFRSARNTFANCMNMCKDMSVCILAVCATFISLHFLLSCRKL